MCVYVLCVCVPSVSGVSVCVYMYCVCVCVCVPSVSGVSVSCVCDMCVARACVMHTTDLLDSV